MHRRKILSVLLTPERRKGRAAAKSEPQIANNHEIATWYCLVQLIQVWTTRNCAKLTAQQADRLRLCVQVSRAHVVCIVECRIYGRFQSALSMLIGNHTFLVWDEKTLETRYATC